MAAMRRLALPLLVPLILAGCAGPQATPTDPESIPSPTRGPAPASPSLPPSDAPASTPPPVAPAGPSARNRTIDEQGVLPPAIRVCPAHGVMPCQSVVSGLPRDRFPFALDGWLDRVGVTLTWTSSSPLTKDLRLSVHACPASCDEATTVAKAVAGPSPLLLEFTATEWKAGTDLQILVGPTAITFLDEGQTQLAAHTEQTFQLDGYFVEAGAAS